MCLCKTLEEKEEEKEEEDSFTEKEIQEAQPWTAMATAGRTISAISAPPHTHTYIHTNKHIYYIPHPIFIAGMTMELKTSKVQ